MSILATNDDAAISGCLSHSLTAMGACEAAARQRQKHVDTMDLLTPTGLHDTDNPSTLSAARRYMAQLWTAVNTAQRPPETAINEFEYLKPDLFQSRKAA